MDTASPPARDPVHRRFRIAVLAASLVAAVVGSTLLVTWNSGEKTTKLGVTDTLAVAGHPGAVIAGPDALWVALEKPSGGAALVRLDLTTGAVAKTVYLDGEVSHLVRVGNRLIASVKHAGSRVGQVAVLDWRSGAVLDRHWYGRPVDQIVVCGTELWALEEGTGTLVGLDPATLFATSAQLPLSTGRTPTLASGRGYLWVTAADTGEVLRIDPATQAIKRVRVGGSPVGLVVTGGSVWFTDRDRGLVSRLDPRTLLPVGKPIPVGSKPSRLAVAAGSLFVTDEEDGTVRRIDARAGSNIGLPIRVAAPVRHGPPPSVASSGQSIWVSTFAASTLTRVTATAARDDSRGTVTVRMTGTNDHVPPVTDGSRQGTGRFTASGAISEKGKVTAYRTQEGPLITIRFVTADKRGTITFLVEIHTDLVPVTSRWTITSATNAYNGLRGEGIESDNVGYTVSTLSGTVSR